MCPLRHCYYPKPTALILMLLSCYTHTVRGNGDEHFLAEESVTNSMGLNETSIQGESRSSVLIRGGV